MGLLDALWHLSNLVLPAVVLGALSAALAKLLWRRELMGVPYGSLAWPASASCAAVVLGGLVLFGRDGKMTTYAVMVATCALMLWWRGFQAGR
jgi:hypothetical protein